MDTGTTQGSTSPTENQDDPEAAQGIISGGETELRNNIEDMFPKTMGTILKERLSAQTRDTETEYCTVAKLRNITPDVIPPDTLRKIERITKGLSVRLQGLMQSLFPSAPYPSTRGRLNTAKLFRIKTGNPKVFIQKTEAVAINTSLHILLDASASMYGKRMELATASCHAIASACSGIRGLNITITVFNGNHRGDACSVYPLLKIRTTRSCPHQPHSPRRNASGPRALVDHETTSVCPRTEKNAVGSDGWTAS